MAILFTVCGRAGSKGFQSKNLKDFLGVPLVYYTLAAIRLWQQRADEEIDVVLNTDSEALCGIVTRPEKPAGTAHSPPRGAWRRYRTQSLRDSGLSGSDGGPHRKDIRNGGGSGHHLSSAHGWRCGRRH